jgi:hypothetical protein
MLKKVSTLLAFLLLCKKVIAKHLFRQAGILQISLEVLDYA